MESLKNQPFKGKGCMRIKKSDLAKAKNNNNFKSYIINKKLIVINSK